MCWTTPKKKTTFCQTATDTCSVGTPHTAIFSKQYTLKPKVSKTTSSTKPLLVVLMFYPLSAVSNNLRHVIAHYVTAAWYKP